MFNRNSKRNKPDEPHLNFRNTRSKFYKKKSQEMDDNSQRNSKQNSQKNTGIYWKEQGNIQFKKNNFQKAIQYYSKAIVNQKTPSQSIYFCNRAKCHKSLNNLKQALKDAQQACQLQPQNIKANYICGCILAQLTKIDKSKGLKAQNRLKKGINILNIFQALRLCSSFKKQKFEDQISIKYYRLKKLMWYIEQSQEIEDLIVEKKLLGLKNINQNNYGRILTRIQKKLKQLQEFQSKKQIPDYLCCKITLELMEDPVTTEQGFTYEKSALQDHFKTNGFIEPISRKKLSSNPYPNLALKNAIQDFLTQNPWAFQDNLEQNYLQIQF